MNAVQGIRMKNPAHPGGFVKSEIIEALELSVTDAAKAFGVSMDTLMRMQNSYDIAQARKREGEIKVAPFKGKPNDPPSTAT